MSPLGLGGRVQQPNVSDLPPTRSTSAPPLTGLTCGLQVIEGLHRAGAEFRSLSEDFDMSTATGKLQLAKVLAFSEWWCNSIRERPVAGQAKARAEGRFPGRRPSLTQRQRECIMVERSKGVSQRPDTKLAVMAGHRGEFVKDTAPLLLEKRLAAIPYCCQQRPFRHSAYAFRQAIASQFFGSILLRQCANCR